MKKPKPEPTKFEALGELLRLYGMDIIDEARFWRDMERNGFTAEDINEWCTMIYYAENG